MSREPKPGNLRNGIPRYFSSCDCARVARNVVDDRGVSPESVVACVAKGLGFTYLGLSDDILPITDPLEEVDALEGPLKDVEDLLGIGFAGFLAPTTPGTGTVIKKQVLTVLQKLPLVKLLIAVAVLVKVITDAKKKTELCNCKPVDAWIEPNTCNCKE